MSNILSSMEKQDREAWKMRGGDRKMSRVLCRNGAVVYENRAGKTAKMLGPMS
jgi:hypothetical protein